MRLVTSEAVGLVIDFATPETGGGAAHGGYPIRLTIDAGRTVVELIKAVQFSGSDAFIMVGFEEGVVIGGKFRVEFFAVHISANLYQFAEKSFGKVHVQPVERVTSGEAVGVEMFCIGCGRRSHKVYAYDCLTHALVCIAGDTESSAFQPSHIFHPCAVGVHIAVVMCFVVETCTVGLQDVFFTGYILRTCREIT